MRELSKFGLHQIIAIVLLLALTISWMMDRDVLVERINAERSNLLIADRSILRRPAGYVVDYEPPRELTREERTLKRSITEKQVLFLNLLEIIRHWEAFYACKDRLKRLEIIKSCQIYCRKPTSFKFVTENSSLVFDVKCQVEFEAFVTDCFEGRLTP
jgi:hypothetical protein